SFISVLSHLPTSTLFPYTTLFRSGFVPYSPLNRGFLGGMINEYTRFDTANDNRQTLPRFQPEAIRANTRIVEVLNAFGRTRGIRSEEHTSELQSRFDLVCRLLLEK